MALDPGVKAYCSAVRTGLCNAYLAASVVDSGVVSTSKIGVMGKVSGEHRSDLTCVLRMMGNSRCLTASSYLAV